MKIKSAIIGGLALAFSMGSAHATQFVKNGDFTELTSGLGQLGYDTAATGWATTGYNFVFTQADQSVNGSYAGLSLWDQANGGASTWNGLTKSGTGNFVAMDSDFETAPLTQTITGLTSGKTYYLTFNYAFGQQYGFSGPTVQSLTASLGGTSWTSANFDVANHGFTGWQSVEVGFKANSTSEVLSFLASGNLPVPPFALVSNVSMTAGVPELSTWALMLMGFAGLGFAGHRRAKNRAVA
ncbi:MAG: hypothetical protein ACLPIC_00215 [Rhodoblastus sp.]|uniref:hypothetical protein n=1 Tax=Rhodoblastus sp. TaxID=1962975 RepID=UPI003F96DD96